jgi:hypothetical protein
VCRCTDGEQRTKEQPGTYERNEWRKTQRTVIHCYDPVNDHIRLLQWQWPIHFPIGMYVVLFIRSLSRRAMSFISIIIS